MWIQYFNTSIFYGGRRLHNGGQGDKCIGEVAETFFQHSGIVFQIVSSSSSKHLPVSTFAEIHEFGRARK